MEQVVLKCSTMDNGGQSAITDGIYMMLGLHVVNLVILMQSDLFVGAKFHLALGPFGYPMSFVLAKNAIYQVVIIINGEVILAHTLKTLE